jgi:hypothetical protein
MLGRVLPVLVVVAAISAAGVIAPASAHASSASASPSVRVSPESVQRGEAIVVTGRGWRRTADVELLIGPPRSEGKLVATVRTTSQGTFRRRLTLPAFVQRRLGRWVLLACRRGCRVKAVKSFHLVR